MKGCFIVNPKSGVSLTRNSVYSIITKLLTGGVAETICTTVTQGKGDATEKASLLDPEEYDFVVAVGGDGTANEVLNGLMKSGSGIPMALLPYGTTNDFATSVGLPRDPAAVVSMLKAFRTVKTDVGAFYTTDRNDAKYFLNVVAGGMLSAVAHSVPANQKNAFGRLAYLIEGAKNLTSLSLDTSPLIIDCDGTVYRENAFLVEISNSRSTGGFTKIAPSAYINDGKFNLCLIRQISSTDIVPVFNKISAGTHLDDPRILCTSASKITISRDPQAYTDKFSFPMDYDGEVAPDLPATIENIPGALNLIVPNKKRTAKTISGFEPKLLN